MDLSCFTPNKEENFRTLIQKWNSGINITNKELEYLIHVFTMFQIWLSETKECNVLLYEIRRKIDIANGMVQSRNNSY